MRCCNPEDWSVAFPAVRAILTLCCALAALPGGAFAAGPDVIVGQLSGVQRFGRVGDITAYAVGTISCNIGDTNLLWDADTSLHPVIAQNLYRLRDGRFEQIGMSWLKHAFGSTNESGLCGTCIDPDNSQLLGPGCHDPYQAGLNGNQFLLGPRSEVNAFTGVFPYPFGGPPAPATIGRRIQVHDADLRPSLNAGAKYFLEGQYVTPDDAQSGNGFNNASHQEAMVAEPSTDVFTVSLTGSTVQQAPAIFAWQFSDPSVVVVAVNVPGDGRLYLAAKATDLGTGFWSYEYALHNLNCDRSVGSFSVPLDANAAAHSIGFHDVDYHSGEPYDLADWPSSRAGGALSWQTVPYAVNANANALRWGTLYNFRFVSNAPPIPNASISLGLFKPGPATSVSVMIVGPSPAPVDCDDNSVPDYVEIQGNPSLDCDLNGNLDACDPDCDSNGTPDACDIAAVPMRDCNTNGRLDVCEIEQGSGAPGGPFFCTSACDPDCNFNGRPDTCDIDSGFSADCNANGVPDECDVALSMSPDCNLNLIPDECEIAAGSPAPGGPFFCMSGCDPDCNVNGIPDACDISSNEDPDCDFNGTPDSCDIAGNPMLDCNEDGVIDVCTASDCNGNMIADECEFPACPGILGGDMDCSGVTNLNDLPSFVEAVLNGTISCPADANKDGAVNGLDVQAFIDAL